MFEAGGGADAAAGEGASFAGIVDAVDGVEGGELGGACFEIGAELFCHGVCFFFVKLAGWKVGWFRAGMCLPHFTGICRFLPVFAGLCRVGYVGLGGENAPLLWVRVR